MSLGDRLEEMLDRPETGRGRLEFESEDGAVAQVDLLDSDRLGATVDRVRVTVPEPGSLPKQAERIADRVRELGGPLVPIEIDERLGGGTLRTAPEAIRRGHFYEIGLDGDGAEVDRYQVGEDGRRERRPYTLTREQLGRLVDDLADGLSADGDS